MVAKHRPMFTNDFSMERKFYQDYTDDLSINQLIYIITYSETNLGDATYCTCCLDTENAEHFFFNHENCVYSTDIPQNRLFFNVTQAFLSKRY